MDRGHKSLKPNLPLEEPRLLPTEFLRLTQTTGCPPTSGARAYCGSPPVTRFGFPRASPPHPKVRARPAWFAPSGPALLRAAGSPGAPVVGPVAPVLLAQPSKPFCDAVTELSADPVLLQGVPKEGKIPLLFPYLLGLP